MLSDGCFYFCFYFPISSADTPAILNWTPKNVVCCRVECMTSADCCPAGLENDEYTRKTDGYLPTAEVAFIDEIFKANSAILNALLTLLNERLFDNGNQRLEVPLLCLVSPHLTTCNLVTFCNALYRTTILYPTVTCSLQPSAGVCILHNPCVGCCPGRSAHAHLLVGGPILECGSCSSCWPSIC